MKLSKEKLDGHVYKKKYWGGLMGFSFDMNTSSAIYKLLGVKIGSSSLTAGITKVQLFGFIKFRSKKLTRRMLEPLLILYLRKLGVDTTQRQILAWYNRSGEFFLLNFHLKDYLRQHDIHNPVLITPQDFEKEVLELFGNHCETQTIHYVFHHLHFAGVEKIEQPKLHYFGLMPHKHFVQVEKKLQNGSDLHFYTALKETVQVSDSLAATPEIPRQVAQTAEEKMRLLGLHKPFVYIAPSAQSNGTLSKSFWSQLPLSLAQLGYDFFFNNMPHGLNNSYCKTCYLSLPEARYVASQAAAIIGIRSGLMDVIANKTSEIICIYKHFGHRSKEFPHLEASRVMSGFSLKPLPHVEPSHLHEIDGDSESEENILRNISTILSNIKH